MYPLATPRKTSFRLDGADGGPLRVDVRSGGGARPAVVCCHGLDESKDGGFFPALADRLARAGFAAVTFDFSGAAASRESLTDLGIILDALARGDLGAPPTAIGIMGHDGGGAVAIRCAAADPRIRAIVTWSSVSDRAAPDVGAPLLDIRVTPPEVDEACNATVDWFGRHLA